MKKYDIVIIGAGSVGLPLSFFLAKAGKNVAVIEKCISVGQGQNKAAIGGIRATHSDPAKIKIGQISIDILKNMEKEHNIDIGWKTGGYMFPIYDDVKENALKNLLKVQKEFKLNIDWISPDEVEKLAPGIVKEKLKGATYSPDDGSASPMKIAGAFYKLAVQTGVDFFFNEEIQNIEYTGKRISAVVTAKNTYEADLFVNAAGANAREIGEMTGLDLPVYPDSHEAGITEAVTDFVHPMIVDIRSDDSSDNYYFYQNDEGQIVFCITPSPKFKGTDSNNISSFLPLVVKRMLLLYPRLRNLRIRRTWRGQYPMTPDGFPIVGYTNEFDNMLLMVGMCGQGLMLGPGLGKVMSEIIVNDSKEYDFILEQLSLYRKFEGDELLK